jgi:hypothetical protein
MKAVSNLQDLPLPRFPLPGEAVPPPLPKTLAFTGGKSLSFTDTHRLTRTVSGERERVSILPPTSTPPTVDDLLSMFMEDTQTDLVIDPLSGVMSDDILEETYVVTEEELLTSDDDTRLCLQVYYIEAPPATDVDLIPDGDWKMTSYHLMGDEQLVCLSYIDGREVQVWRVQDGFIAQPTRES